MYVVKDECWVLQVKSPYGRGSCARSKRIMLTEFQCNPFDVSNSTLRSLQSGLPASDELSAYIKSAKREGEKMVKVFMDERVYAKSSSLNDRIPRSQRLNFGNMGIKSIDGVNMKGKERPRRWSVQRYLLLLSWLTRLESFN